MKPPRYLGDGVYAEWDGFGVWLKANDAFAPTDKVYLEPEVFRALVQYVKEAEDEERRDR